VAARRRLTWRFSPTRDARGRPARLAPPTSAWHGGLTPLPCCDREPGSGKSLELRDERPAVRSGPAARPTPVPGTIDLRRHVTRSNLLPALVRRPAALALQGATLTALIAGGTAWTMTDKTVTVSVDGQTRTLATHAGTVGQLLADNGLAVGEHDVVAPSPTSDLRDGGQVSVRHGRPLSLVVDGAPRTVWVTSDSVDEALSEIGLRNDGAALSASRSREIPLQGISLDVWLPKAATVLVDGKRIPLTTTAPTVAGVLAQAGVVLRPLDRVSVPVATAVLGPVSVKVTRVDAQQAKVTSAVPYTTLTRRDGTLYRGTRKVVTAGRPGTLVSTYKVTVVDGKARTRALVSQVRTVAPVSRVVAVGTKARPAPRRTSYSSGGGGGLNWAALARCESGGNPRAVSSSGTYRGLYQFDYSTWRSVGGSGDPIDASSSEQTHRARILYSSQGRSPWPVCGKYL
jgi:resuscitation-promoting factor RpfB